MVLGRLKVGVLLSRTAFLVAGGVSLYAQAYVKDNFVFDKEETETRANFSFSDNSTPVEINKLKVLNTLYVDNIRALLDEGLHIKLGQTGTFKILKKKADGTYLECLSVTADGAVAGLFSGTAETHESLILPQTLSVSGSTALSDATVSSALVVDGPATLSSLTTTISCLIGAELTVGDSITLAGSMIQGAYPTTKTMGTVKFPLFVVDAPSPTPLFSIQFADSTGLAYVKFSVIGRDVSLALFVYRAYYLVTPIGIYLIEHDTTFNGGPTPSGSGNAVATTGSISSGDATSITFSTLTPLTGPAGLGGPLVFYEVMGDKVSSVS